MKKDFWEEITTALVALDAAREKRKLSFQQYLANKDQTRAASVLANEIVAEKRVKQLMAKYADMADTWLRRGTKNSLVDQDAVHEAQTFAELEVYCQKVLTKSETNSLMQQYSRLFLKNEKS